MSKAKRKTIEKQDIEDYLNTSSDFAFEIRVLNKLSRMGFKCEHSGIYEDPITKKWREFDIRGYKELDYRRLRVSVECKNLRDTYPLIAHCVQRSEDESYHDLLVRHRNSSTNSYSQGVPVTSYVTSTRIRIRNCLYKTNSHVAKSVDQVGKTQDNIISNDGSVYDKVSQAIHSAYDLIDRAHREKQTDTVKATVIMPILVVPDGRLWKVVYDDEGSIVIAPEQTSHISYYVGQSWRVGHYNQERPGYSDIVWYTLSHLELVTLGALEELVNNYFNPVTAWANAFTDKPPTTLMRMPEFREC